VRSIGAPGKGEVNAHRMMWETRNMTGCSGRTKGHGRRSRSAHLGSAVAPADRWYQDRQFGRYRRM